MLEINLDEVCDCGRKCNENCEPDRMASYDEYFSESCTVNGIEPPSRLENLQNL